MWFFVQLCSSWQDFNWLKASRSPSVIAELLVLPRVQTSTGQRSFAYSGPAVWNSLPPALRENMSLATFKTKLKTYLFRRPQWLSKSTRRCCGGFAISAPWYKWLYLLTYLLTYLPILGFRWHWQQQNHLHLAHPGTQSVGVMGTDQ